MIIVRVWVRHHDGEEDLTCPVVVCDECGKELTAKVRAIALWARASSQVFTVCDGVCDRKLSARMGDGSQTGGFRWRPLAELMFQLGHNFTEELPPDSVPHTPLNIDEEA